MMKHFIPIALVMMLLAVPVAAQQASEPAPPAAADAAASAPAVPASTPFDESFLFSPAELSLLYRAAAGIGITSTGILGADNTLSVPQSRTIRIGGLVYHGPDNWVVWINGYKATPGNLPSEVVAIRVDAQRVHLKWFDVGLNGVLTLSLRPHQVYDIVTGILLPGG